MFFPRPTNSSTLQHKYEAEFAHNPEYIEMYRTGNAYHGVHPFYMWYWGENGRAHVGKVIVVGAENPRTAEVMGLGVCRKHRTGPSRLAHSHVGHPPSVTHIARSSD